MNLGLAKILSIFSATSVSAGGFLCQADNLINVSDSSAAVLEMLVNGFLTLLGNIIYYLCQFALSLIDFLQVIVYKFLGLTKNVQDFKVYDKNNPLIKFLTNDTVIDVLRTAMVVAVVLVIVFTIFSILMGEWNRAANQTEYSIRMVWNRAFRSLLGMLLFPAAFMAAIILTNSLLASLSAVFTGSSNVSLGGQVFALCSYDANVYRNYANNNKRIPIYIDFYDPYADGTHTRYTTDELAGIYDAFATDGKELYNKFANEDFLSFADSASYTAGNKSITNNYDTYGEYEKFVCTAEQYQVMADFIDYAVSNGITYYYKPIGDADIEWKYVDSTQYNPSTGSLMLNYRDASNLFDGKSYSVVYDASPYNISSPIQDALGTLSTLLSFDGEGYNMLDHLEGSINKVAWATDKVKLSFSENYQNTALWTVQDQILLYEYYRYSNNNTLQNYTLTDIESGIYLDAYTLHCQYYRDYTNSYHTLVEYQVAIINGNYYLIEQATKMVYNAVTQKYENVAVCDEYGDPLYQIKNGSNVGTLLSNLSTYNKDNNAEVGVNIKLLDTNTEEAWYSATVDSSAVELPKNVFNLYMPDTRGVEFGEREEPDGSKVILYGFPNANGFYQEVDRLKAIKNVKQVDWVNKLMGDLKAIYRDLNLEQLITTGEWLKAFNSEIEQINGEYVASFDTSMISPQGLVFSEIFLGILKESDGSNLADYMFASKYSQKELREMVLALCGEENYETVSATINYFVDTFNLLFTPLLEKIMTGEGQSFIEGEVTSVQLYTYKAYLCSLLLSTDSAAFFLDIARELVVMYQFQYDVLAVEPANYNNAMAVIKEHLNPDIYGPSKSLKYSFDLSRQTIDFVKYLDVATDSDGKTDGIINQEDLLLIYEDTSGNGKIDVAEITEERTPKNLLKDINNALSRLNRPFADVIIEELANNSLYYAAHSDVQYINLANYGFRQVYDNKSNKNVYVFENANVNSYNQLADYSSLCSAIYSSIAQEFNKTSSECLVVKVYNNVRDNLLNQGVDETSESWPKYMNIYKQYLLGSINPMLLSDLISTENVAGRLNEYDTYLNIYEKAEKRMADSEVLEYFSKMELFNSRDTILKEYGIYSGSGNSSDYLINRYYADSTTEKKLSLAELLSYSYINQEEFVIRNNINGYLKQELVADQLDLIVKYAVDNNLVADVLKKELLNGYVLYNKDPDDPDKLIEANSGEIIAQKQLNYLSDYAYAVRNMLNAQMTLNEYHKYYISYAVRMNSTENAGKTFKVIVNNHIYNMSLTMPTAKLTEYLLGGVYLNHLGFESAYVDKDYKGFFNITYANDGTIGLPAGNSANFDSINMFMNNLAEVSMQAYYMSNLNNLTKSNLEETKLSELFYKIVVEGTQTTYHVDYVYGDSSYSFVKLILINILENKYLDENVVRANMLESEFNNTGEFYADAITFVKAMELEDAYNAFNSTMAYLTGSVKDYHTLSMKQFRLELFNALADYQPNSSSTADENKNRYITLFYMLCSDFVETKTGSNDPTTNKPNKKIYFVKDTSTQGIILRLAGIADMPPELLVGLEYEGLQYGSEGIDENNGDYFIICTFDEETQTYIPFLMNSGKSNKAYQTTKAIVDGEEQDVSWLKFGYGVATTSYYVSTKEDTDSQSFPIIAKGIITPEGLPTAIRQVDGVIEFYRDNLAIRNTSELSLNAYYMTTESLSVDYNLFSLITNSISKVFTGKTLVEHAYSKIPKFEIDSDIRLPIGVDDLVVRLTDSAICVDYTFTHMSGLSSQNFYTTIKINFLILLVAIIALLPMLIKAIYGVFGRVIDVTLYYCMSPVMMSTIALGKNTGEGKEELPIYKTWMSSLTKKTLSVFGYVIGFQVFFTLVPFFAGVEFISDLSLFKAIPFFDNITILFINRIVNIIMIICSAYLITEAPAIFAEILGQSNGFADGEQVKNNIKATVAEVKETINGSRAVAPINYMVESTKQALGINTVLNAVGTVKKAGAKVISKGVEYYLRAKGVPKDKANKIGKMINSTVKTHEKNKRNLRDENRIKAEDAYFQQVGLLDGPSSKNHKKLQKIDKELYEAGIRSHTDKQHKAIQKQFDKTIKAAEKAEKEAKKKKEKEAKKKKK